MGISRKASDALALLMLSLAFLLAFGTGRGMAVTCTTLYGGSGNDTLYGSDACADTIWTYDGVDTAWGFNMNDALHMGAGSDVAHAGNGEDFLYMGDNPTSSQDLAKAGAGGDEIHDQTGPDWDYGCGGDGTDHFRYNDGDALDTAKGEAHQYGHIDLFDGDNGDSFTQDGSC